MVYTIATADFDTLARAEPRLRHLETAIRAIHAEPGEPFCANGVWKGGLKQLMLPLVGHLRGYPPKPARDPNEDTWKPVDLTPYLDGSRSAERAPVGGNEWEEFLRTEEAYSIAYQHLFNLLPGCHRCGCIPIIRE